MKVAVLAGVVFASMLQGNAQPNLQTRAETSNYEETSTYDDVMRVMKGVVAGSPLARYESYGKSEEGREMPLLVLSEPAVATPEEARKLGRPIVYIQGNIHAGEVEGKEAALILARRLTQGDLRPLLAQLVVIIAPIYNADGNEKVNVQNRTAQYGPVAGVGTRENSKGLDLNRDHIKLDSAEARALIGLLNRWDPHVGIDLHTTNGSYHGYHLTYSPTLNPNADARLVNLTRDNLLAYTQQRVLAKHKFRTYYYGNFASESGMARESSRVDPAKPGDTVWRTFDHRPRFNNNYLGLRNRIALLSEAYSYLDFRGRVRVTEVFVEEALGVIAENAPSVINLTARLDGEARTFATTGSPISLGVEFQITPLRAPVDILVGDVEKKPNPRSGREMLAMTEMATPVRMKDYGLFTATRSLRMPRGWLIPAAEVKSGRLAAALDRLKWHGVQTQTLQKPTPYTAERFTIATYTRNEKPFQNRNEARLTGSYETTQMTAAAGSVLVTAGQPLARLAFYLLEAESDDGLVTWNIIEQGLTAGSVYPVLRIK